MAAPIVFEIRADTADAVRDLEALESQLDDVSESGEGASGGADAAGAAFQGMGELAGESKTQVVGLVDGLGASIPIFGQAKAAAQGFGAAMGPLGVALGVITVIAPTVIKAFRDMGDAADEETTRMQRATRRIRASFDDLRAFNTALVREERAQLRDELNDLELQIARSEMLGQNARGLRLRAGELRAELEFGVFDDGQGGPGPDPTDDDDRPGGGGSPDPKAEAVRAEMDRAAQALKASLQTLEDEIAAGVDNALDMALGLGDQQIIDRENAQKDHLARVAQALREFEEEQRRAAEELAKQEAQFANDKAQATRDAADQQKTKSIAAAETGIAAANMIAANFAETQGQMELIQGLSDAAMAITKFASQDYASGALYLVSSGLHFANAAQMGAGGGSNAAASAAGGAAAGARPVPSGQGLGGGGGPGNFTVNINSPMTERDIGRTQRRAEQERMRRFDPSV